MKGKFSAHWNSSKQARKQRKFRFNAPSHIKRKLMSAHLSKELRKKTGRRSAPLRKGDSVTVMTGEFRKKTGKIMEINNYKLKVYVEGIQRQKKDGTKVNVQFDPSNLLITELTEDKKRNLIKENKK